MPRGRLLTALALVALLLVGIEAIATVVAVLRQLQWTEDPVQTVLDRFVLSRMLIGTFTRPSSKEIFASSKVRGLDTVDATHRDLGDVWDSLLRSRELFPADGLLAYRNAPSVIATDRHRFLYLINAQGFGSIGETTFSYERPKPAGVYRVIVVGGSTIFGKGAPTPDQNLPAHLVERLRRLRPAVEVINAGVLAYRSADEFLYIAGELLDYEPDLIIVYDGWNDLEWNHAVLREHPTTPNALKGSYHYEAARRLNQTSHVVGALATLVGVARQTLLLGLDQIAAVHLAHRAAVRTVEWIGVARGAQPPDMSYNPRSVAMYRRNLMNIIAVTRIHGVRVAVFLQPLMGVDGKVLSPEEQRSQQTLSPADLERRRRYYADARTMVAELSARFAAPGQVCIDDLSQTFEGNSTPLYAGTGHLLPAGNELIADQIAKRLARCGVLDKVPHK
jgi:lysophospholipase L1-like esterase